MSDEKTKRAGLRTVRLNVKFPCCGGQCRLVAVVDVPREIYARKCVACGTRWEVNRRTARQTDLKRIDILEWDRMDRPVQMFVHGDVAAVLARARGSR